MGLDSRWLEIRLRSRQFVALFGLSKVCTVCVKKFTSSSLFQCGSIIPWLAGNGKIGVVHASFAHVLAVSLCSAAFGPSAGLGCYINHIDSSN